MDDHTTECDTAFFPDFPAHGVFDGLGGLDESRESGVPVRGPAFLAAEEDTLAVLGEDSDDDGGVRAGEGEVAEGCAGAAGGAGAGCFEGWGGGRGADGALRERGEVGWGADSFGAPVGGEGWLAAGAAEGVAGVPVEHCAGLRVHRRCGRGELGLGR